MASAEQFQELVNHMKEKDKQIEALMQQMQNQQASSQQQFQQVQQEMMNMRTQHDATVTALQTALQQTVQTVATAKASNKTLVDNKGIGKPNTFDSDMKKFPNFSFKFKNFVQQLEK